MSTQSSTSSTTSSAAGKPYFPALDGIRALAVIAVVLYHLGGTLMPGGFLGVTVFFVISGYIITTLLLHEYASTERIDLKAFWVRRIRRLLPAVLALIAGTAALCTVFNHVMLTKMRPDIIPSVFFVNNWWQIAHNVSYFSALGDPSPLTHFWSLAIEEQFYLVWPVVLLVLMGTRMRKRTVRRGVLLAAAASAIAMVVLYNPAQDPSRLYYGTDTRAFSLLLGVWLAFIPRSQMTPRHLMNFLFPKRFAKQPARDPNVPARSLDLIGGVGLIGLMALFFLSNGYTSFQYRGGMLLCSLFTLMLIAAAVQPTGFFERILAVKPLVWIGKRSYSIYLWHYPLLLLMNPASDLTQDPWWQTLTQLAIVLAAAELSYRFVETPFRHGLVGKAIAQRREGNTIAHILRPHALGLVCATAVVALAGAGVALVPDTSAISQEGADIINANKEDEKPQAAADAALADVSVADGAYDVLMIGDSVSLRTVPVFEQTFPYGHIDAAKNRQFTTGMDLLDGYLANNQVGNVVVMALGTNGVVSTQQLDALVQKLGEKRRIVLVNTRSPQPWVEPTNKAMSECASKHDNVRVIDWHGLSEGKDDLFDGDGTHLSTKGAEYYIGLIQDAVSDALPCHDFGPVTTQAHDATAKIIDAANDALTRSLA